MRTEIFCFKNKNKMKAINNFEFRAKLKNLISKVFFSHIFYSNFSIYINKLM